MNEEVRQEVVNTAEVIETKSDKSKVIAALLSFFFGGLGAHRFYLGRTRSALTMMIMTVLGYLTSFILIGYVLLLIVIVWDFIDFFKIIFGALTDNEGRKLR